MKKNITISLKKKDVGLILNRAWMMREANIFSRSGASEAEGRRSEASLKFDFIFVKLVIFSGKHFRSAS